jgi:hypothetical protein
MAEKDTIRQRESSSPDIIIFFALDSSLWRLLHIKYYRINRDVLKAAEKHILQVVASNCPQ